MGRGEQEPAPALAAADSGSEASELTLFRGGQTRVLGGGDESVRRVRDILGHLLQVRNLSVLIGAGASFHLGMPHIRSMTATAVQELVTATGTDLTERQQNLIQAMVGESCNLEDILTTLSIAVAYTNRMDDNTVHVGGDSFPVGELVALRVLMNRGLASACDLDKATDANTLIARLASHREFLRKLVRSRRVDLPRTRVFTTNYDLALEYALDAGGIAYFDGFSGTLRRTFQPEVYQRDLHLPPAPGERRISRLNEVLYLYKLHGSINWRGAADDRGLEQDLVYQISPSPHQDEGLVLIYPTPQKEAETLGFPYSELFRIFGSSLQAPEAALIVVGCSLRDRHVNRFIHQALSANPTFQLLVIEPFGIPALDALVHAAGNRESLTTAGLLALSADPRIAVLTGSLAQFETFADDLMPDPDELAVERGDADLIAAALSENRAGST